MSNLHHAVEASECIQSLALKAVKRLPTSHPAYPIALLHAKKPVDYIRYAEFDAILKFLELNPSTRILDISSPQWFSIYLAFNYPDVEIDYINIIDRELEAFKEIAFVLELKNLRFTKADVRKMGFKDHTFEKAISISVIEHIYPEKDGDIMALNEIRRVLKPGGEFLMTVPYKSKSNIVYTNGAVYERSKKTNNFYAREYDEIMFSQLVQRTGFTRLNAFYISEKKGVLAEDYYKWGPGKGQFPWNYLIKIRKKVEAFTRLPITKAIARNYLKVSRENPHRLVNIAVKLEPKD